MAWLGHGKVRQVRQGRAGSGAARQGIARLARISWERSGEVWTGETMQGVVRCAVEVEATWETRRQSYRSLNAEAACGLAWSIT
jgi:hypothetical protein